MSALAELVWLSLRDTVAAVVPIAGLLAFFQLVVLRRPVPGLARVLIGFTLVVLGMSLFLAGLEEALFPLGRLMAEQLTDPGFVGASSAQAHWADYAWVYAFGGCVGFATTLAEPALIAVALKAEEVSGGTVRAWGLRLAVAVGAGAGIALGCFRIVSGTPLTAYIAVGYVLVLVQAVRAPRAILALAFDSGGVTTSTVTVPVVTALGLGLASAIPGRSTLVDGFGMIALTVLVPIMTVMGYAQVAQWRSRSRLAHHRED